MFWCALAFLARTGGMSGELPLEVFAIMQHRPRKSGVLGRNGDYRFPVASSFDKLACPAAEAVLFVSKTCQYRASVGRMSRRRYPPYVKVD